MVRRFMLAAVVALSAVLLTAPAALAQYDDYGSESSSGQRSTDANTGNSGGNTGGGSGGQSSGGESASTGDNDCPATPPADATILNGEMNGKVEVPPGDPDGTGRATLFLDGDKVWFKLAWEGIEAPNLAHIHQGRAGQAGDPVVTLFQGAEQREGCVTADAAVVRKIIASPADYYINIHNEPHPKGAIRAQLAKGERATLPFTGDTSQRLLWLGSAITVMGMLLVHASRRYGIRPGRHLAPAHAGRGRRRTATRHAAPTRAMRRTDHMPW